MSNINHISYQKYEEYSTMYVVDIHKLNTYILSLKPEETTDTLIEQWIQNNCYYILASHLIDDFLTKLDHNLVLAKRDKDTQYIIFISNKLHINIDQTHWTYTPNMNKIKIKLKHDVVKEGYKISEKLTNLLNVPVNMTYKYKSYIIRLIHKYIYDNQLQNRYDKNTITPNDQLLTVLSPLTNNEHEYTYNNITQHIEGIIPICN